MRGIIHRLAATWPAAVLALSACASLPDTSGYTAATSQMSTTVTAGGDVVARNLGRAAELMQSEEARTATTTAARRFREAWGQTDTATRVMVDYAESIEAIGTSRQSVAMRFRPSPYKVRLRAGGCRGAAAP